MARFFPALTAEHRDFIAAQPLFFTATAAPDGRVNLSPKGYDCLRVMDDRRVAWVNLTGSGNETAAHLRISPRITVMFMSVARRPQIMRLFGTARAIHRGEDGWDTLAEWLPRLPGARQIIDMQVDQVQTSCGYGVPFMQMTGERDTLLHWAEDKGEDGLRRYWAERNAASIDGLPTGIGAAIPDTAEARHPAVAGGVSGPAGPDPGERP